MDDALTVSLIYAIAIPLVTLGHELGHAVVPLLKTREPVRVQLGPASSPPLFQTRLGRLTFDVRRLFFVGGCCFWPGLTPRQHFWAVAGGPLASLLMLVVGAAALVGIRTEAVWLVAQIFMTLSFFQLVMTLWPMQYPAWYAGYAGFQSDGAQLLRLWPRLRPAR
ncbi:M50 family metallopeptidase [Deinococcus sp. NW-56]|uniref:M50 family metallopeptidase n=1 Tax=Deinococcus sp. NW-56 TaxID=2080419 RepID=UPI000CF44494|nr:M50 family metallopeptidase [Deinococcus sp. NW-56]